MGHLFDWEETPEEAQARRFLGFIAWLLCLLVLGAILSAAGGCAAKPVNECQKVEARVFEFQGAGIFYGFTAEAVTLWVAELQREARGECEFRKGEPT